MAAAALEALEARDWRLAGEHLAAHHANRGGPLPRDRDGGTALHVALWMEAPRSLLGQLTVVCAEAGLAKVGRTRAFPRPRRRQLTLGAPRPQDNFGRTPLHLPSVFRRADAIRLIASSWPTACRAADSAGNTPLHLALMYDAS